EREPTRTQSLDRLVVAEHDQRSGAPPQNPFQSVPKHGAGRHERERGPQGAFPVDRHARKSARCERLANGHDPVAESVNAFCSAALTVATSWTRIPAGAPPIAAGPQPGGTSAVRNPSRAASA